MSIIKTLKYLQNSIVFLLKFNAYNTDSRLSDSKLQHDKVLEQINFHTPDYQNIEELKSEEDFKLGKEYYNNGDFEKAGAKYSEVIKKEENLPKV